MSQPLLDLQEVLFRWPGQTTACLDIARLQVEAARALIGEASNNMSRTSAQALAVGLTPRV